MSDNRINEYKLDTYPQFTCVVTTEGTVVTQSLVDSTGCVVLEMVMDTTTGSVFVQVLPSLYTSTQDYLAVERALLSTGILTNKGSPFPNIFLLKRKFQDLIEAGKFLVQSLRMVGQSATLLG